MLTSILTSQVPQVPPDYYLHLFRPILLLCCKLPVIVNGEGEGGGRVAILKGEGHNNLILR